jgi:adenosylhomocysteine nucleosidase
MPSRLLILIAILLGLAAPARATDAPDMTPRTAVISAFAPELAVLAEATADKRTTIYGGATFISGVLEGKPVVLFLSGQSMVNAAMTTQMALDRFHVTRIVFSGIAGGVDPDLDVGDVVVAAQWGQYLESVMARQTAPGQFERPVDEPIVAAPFGMMYPKAVEVTHTPGKVEQRAWFAADPALLDVARKVAGRVTLKQCAGALCLTKPPRVVVGGNGVSGQSFVDNAALRAWAYQAFAARVLDMESAAVGQVAYVNDTPFIAFRSLSDLAGGDPGANQARTFFQLASDNSAAVVRAFLAALPRD